MLLKIGGRDGGKNWRNSRKRKNGLSFALHR